MSAGKRFPPESHRLRDHGSWRAPPGHVVAVIDRGAVRFNVPRSWVVIPEPDVLNIYDVNPPDDNCRLGASYLKLPQNIDWTGLPLPQLLGAAGGADPERRQHGETVNLERPRIQIVWAEFHFEDQREHRQARSRVAVARGSELQALVTLDYWPEDTDRVEPVWAEVMRSIELARYVEDPTEGDVVH